MTSWFRFLTRASKFEDRRYECLSAIVKEVTSSQWNGLNILLSFAQFERAFISGYARDEISAAQRKDNTVRTIRRILIS